MKLRGSISQVKPDYGELSYMNIEPAGQGGIQAWCSTYSCPTFLGKKDTTVTLLQFANDDWAQVWITDHKHHFDSIEPLGEPKLRRG